MRKRKLSLIVTLFMVIFTSGVNAQNLSDLQECRSIKNAVKKAECFEKQTQKMIQQEAERKQREDTAKAEAEKLKVENEKLAAEEKRIAEESKKIEKAQKILLIVKRMQTRIETGVSYRDYSTVISDPKFEVENYVRENSGEIPEFSRAISKSIYFYDAASTIWRFKFSGRGVATATCDSNEKNYINRTLDGAYVPESQDLRNYCQGPDIDSAVRMTWTRASENIAEADAALRKIKNNLK